MKYFFLFSAVLFFVNCSTEDQVLVLDNNNFDTHLVNYEYLMIEFYAPWCGHCKSLEPEYRHAAEILHPDNIFLAKIDATQNLKIAERFAIEGYPTIKFYTRSDNSFKEYEGERTSDAIVKFIRKRIAPPSKEISTLEEFEAHKNSSEVTLVYFGDLNTPEGELYIKVASKFDDCNFAHSVKILENMPFTMGDLILHNFDGIRKFEGNRTEEDLSDFINMNLLPLVTEFNEKAADVVFERNKVGFFLIRSTEDTQYDNIVKSIAPQFRDKIIFIIADIRTELEEKLAEFFYITKSDLPLVRIAAVHSETDAKIYVHDAAITEDLLITFVQNFLSGKLSQYFRSEPIPSEQLENVYYLVGKEFQNVVLENHKIVVVEFYAPWCEHCKEFAPVYEKIAESFKTNDNILFAKVDHTANIIDGVEIDSYPTIKVYLPGAKDTPIEYLGDREPEDFLKFINGIVTPQGSDISQQEEVKSDL